MLLRTPASIDAYSLRLATAATPATSSVDIQGSFTDVGSSFSITLTADGQEETLRYTTTSTSEDAATIALGLAAATNDSGYAGSYTASTDGAILSLVRNDGINFSVGDGQTSGGEASTALRQRQFLCPLTVLPAEVLQILVL